MALCTQNSGFVSLTTELELISLTWNHLMQSRNKELTCPSCRSASTNLCAVVPIVDTLRLDVAVVVELLVAFFVKIRCFFNIITSNRNMHSHHARLARNLNNGCRLLLLTFRLIKVLESIVSALKRSTIIILAYNMIH